MTTPDAYTEDLQRHRHLWGDKGPLWQARQRAERNERPDWFQRHGFRTLFLGGALYLLSVLAYASYALAFDFQPHEVADRSEIPFELVIQSREATANTCLSITRADTRAACAVIHKGKCFVYMRAVTLRFSWRSQQRLLRHEWWHCNGGTHERRGAFVLAPSRSTGAFALMQDKTQ